MTAHDGFTRLLDTWLAEEGAELTPDYLGDVLGRMTTTRQRPAWASLERWLPVTTTIHRARAISLPPTARYVLLAAILAIVALAALVLYAGQRHTVPAPFGPAANGRIYFDLNGKIVSTNAAGRDLQTLTVSTLPASAPYLSPDGTTFAFVVTDPSQVAGDSQWVADLDGSHARRISGDGPMDIDPAFNPTWSPDSRQLAFGAYVGGVHQLFVGNADGSGVRALGDPVVGSVAHAWTNPEWAPSGDWIAFGDETPFVDFALAVIHPDGTGYHRLPTSLMAGEGFRGTQLWAPDLTNRVLYALGADGEWQGKQIAWMDVDTGAETIVSDVPGLEQHRAAWAPDGKRIAFHLGDDMALANPDGSNVVVLKEPMLGGRMTAWSPDGAWLFGIGVDDGTLFLIDPHEVQAPIAIPLVGNGAGLITWQRLAP